MGVFAKLLRRGGSSGEGRAAKEPAPAEEPQAGEAAGTAAQPEGIEEAANADAAAAAGIPKQQSAEGAADSDAGDEARK
ncbi:hypothetical protein [Streptomyces sp. B8F3]|uniref:hypothetical protein n=1 Tax=unclassified Streptomyces TaxID=2593676 RepID=UPI00325F6589